MQVKYLDLPRQFRDNALLNKIRVLFETCQFVLGPEVEAFEANVAKLCQTPFCVGVNSCTDAIFLALKALNIGSGDEVITVPNSFFATAGAIVATGATPVFVDVGEDYNIDAGLIEKAVTDRTKAIVPVHLTGNPADMVRINEIAVKHKLYVIEDAAQAVGASLCGQAVGSFGDVGCFSLHPLKNLNVCGDGGAVTMRSKEIFEKIKLLRNHGLKNRDDVACFGYNSRLDTIQAIVGNHIIEELEKTTLKRIDNAAFYDRELSKLHEWVKVPPRRKDVKQVFHTYVVRVKRISELMKYLSSNGVETKVHYPVPIHLQQPFLALGYKRGMFPNSERQSEEIISLPIHQYLTFEQISFVSESIKSFYQGVDE